MNRFRFCISLLISMSLFWSSCLLEDKEDLSDTAMGEAGELSIFTDGNTWKELGSLVDSVFAGNIPGLVDAEPWFLIRKADESKFEGIFKKNYNVLILVHGENWATLKPFLPGGTALHIEDLLDGNKVKMLRDHDRWGRPQQVHYLVAPKMHQLAGALSRESESYVYALLDAERKSTVSSLLHNVKVEYDTFYQNNLKERGFAIRRTGDFRLSVQSDSFLGISRYLADKFQGIYMHAEPYVSEAQFSKEYILARRNLVMGKHLQGADRPDSLPTNMTTDTSGVALFRRVMKLNGRYTVETRGWWEFQNEFKAGPFVSYTIHCEDLGQIVTLEGILFAPGREKAKLLRQLELIMSTFATRT